MQQDSIGKIPVHKNVKNPIHNFDRMKSVKTFLNNILRSDKDISDDIMKIFMNNYLISNKNKLPDYDKCLEFSNFRSMFTNM